ncbi:MAG: Asp23/Gls24 family envelope stress response protein [Oscillospiraceae bacterium]|nr:Asp23/Gls24 family envelope stress response protein [Oscillospiraceae bacterium]
MSEIKEYITQEQENGAIHISQDVIATIAAVAATEVDGVYALAGGQSGEFSDRFSKKSIAKGIRLRLDENESICIECSVIAQYGHGVFELAKNVQDSVFSAVESVTGLKVGSVEVNVCGINLKK